jgi:hypothetical protein
VSRAFVCVLNTRAGCPQVFCTAPPVIHPMRVHKYPWQASYNAVCKTKTWSLLGAHRQNLSRLRVEKLGCAGSRQDIPAVCQRLDLKQASSSAPGMSAGHCVPLTCMMMPLCCSSWAASGLYALPKTALAALASLYPYPFPVTVLPSSPAYTYLKQHL